MNNARIFCAILLLPFVFLSVRTTKAQPQQTYYDGALEYSLPLLTSVPPHPLSQSSGVSDSYQRVDQLFRTVHWPQIDVAIDSLRWNRTTRAYVSKFYRMIDEDPLAFARWEISAWPRRGYPPPSWNYRATPGHERFKFQNKIGSLANDSARTGFLLACDYISDVLVTDASIPFRHVDENLVLVTTTIIDQIKGQVIPTCNVSTLSKLVKNVTGMRDTFGVTPLLPTKAMPGACFQFEYSPKWQRTDDDDDAPTSATLVLSDSNGAWIKPGAEYIVFLFLTGMGSDLDSTHVSCTIIPFWGDFGKSGAMYRVVEGHVVDDEDDFGLGGRNFTIAEWKSRLRAKIRAIEKYR